MTKKILKISLVLIILIITTVITLYFIDINRINNNDPVLFSTWGKDYTPPVKIHELD